MIDKSGVLADALLDFKKKPIAQQTQANFKIDMILANNRRCCKLTSTGEMGYEANLAKKDGDDKENSPPSDDSSNRTGTTNEEGTRVFYCWSCGLTFHKGHTSANCHRKKEGHVKTATLKNMNGGNCLITRRRGEKSHTQFEHLKLE